MKERGGKKTSFDAGGKEKGRGEETRENVKKAQVEWGRIDFRGKNQFNSGYFWPCVPKLSENFRGGGPAFCAVL